MQWPCLVLEKFCKTDIKLTLDQEGINEYGEPLKGFVYNGKCNYQEEAKRIFTDGKKVVEIAGTALFPGDICPKLPVITSGSAVVHGVARKIIKGTKARNPDGSVNYTAVYLQ